ncbi:ribonuclease P protein component [Candidatus Kaiserbacteria bacterium RIFCSPHIGHO2_01_FULL_55_17]|uniref:Ribonuclease P protein component n=1 Tax=Candidatus Kaiserbacteria bacterium RIFCSPHIGHO2_01_FULL_55_17 TaxID=1798484 RepID=A0A1F6D961_9BACT|nr:MAG: ribonuclease P protein component [Candidatus Kaiserbacteria bacterium RIFCSPHIGHO2_01_FULL_55_17]
MSRVSGALFALSVSPLLKAQGPKFTCVVPKKVAPKAVQRNLIKRRCRAAVRTHIRRVTTPTALIFRARKGILGAPYADIDKDIRTLVDRLVAIG